MVVVSGSRPAPMIEQPSSPTVTAPVTRSFCHHWKAPSTSSRGSGAAICDHAAAHGIRATR